MAETEYTVSQAISAQVKEVYILLFGSCTLTFCCKILSWFLVQTDIFARVPIDSFFQ